MSNHFAPNPSITRESQKCQEHLRFVRARRALLSAPGLLSRSVELRPLMGYNNWGLVRDGEYSRTYGWHFNNQGENHREVRERENNSTGSGGEHERDTAVRKAQSLSDLRTARTNSVIWTLDLRPLQEHSAGGGHLQETPDRKGGGRACSRSIELL